MNRGPVSTSGLRTIEVAIPAELLLQVDEIVLSAKARGEPWGRSELVVHALAVYLQEPPTESNC